MTVRRLLAVAVALIAVAGCSSNPTQPLPQVPLSELTLSSHADTIRVGNSKTYTVVAKDTAGVVVSNPSLVWASSNTNVFRVTNLGVVTGQGEGAAYLTVSSGGQVDTALVLVLTTQRGWFTQQINLTTDLNGVFFQPLGVNGWVVGAAGQIARTTDAGEHWTMQLSNVGNGLNSVWFTTSSEGWVAGDAGRILHTKNSGQHWTVVPSGTIDNLNGIVFATPDTGWAVGANGTILRTFDRGAHWTRTSITSFTLRGVSFYGTRDGWAVGDNGTILGTHDRGLTWYPVLPTVTSNTLNSVHRLSDVLAYAVGDAGAVPQTVAPPDSGAWENRSAGALNNLRSVRFFDSLHGWACGQNGTGLVMVTSDGGTSWTPQLTNNQYTLNGIWFADGLRGWAVGAQGTVIHTVSGGAP